MKRSVGVLSFLFFCFCYNATSHNPVRLKSPLRIADHDFLWLEDDDDDDEQRHYDIEEAQWEEKK